ncbi:MAG: glycosyltransferase family 39 protein [Anaerolineae bacterium]|nr:glycosyltransferase family 39 protein [Anaerolineae bacterium]
MRHTTTDSTRSSARALAKWLDHPYALPGVLALAFLLRVLFLVLADVNAPLTGDELAYQQIAENVLTGRGFFQDNNPFFPGQVLYAWQAPLYPLSLAVAYALFGNSLLVAKGMGIFISTATVYVTYDLARRVFAQTSPTEQDHVPARRIALVAAFLVALYPGFLTHAHLLLSETLFIFLVMLAFDFVARGLGQASARVGVWIFGAGTMWGLATLTRGITLYFTPLFALWIGWALWSGQQRIARALLPALLFAVATALVILPWTARNYSRFGQFVLLETKGGVNLWLGNSPYTPNEFIRNVWKVGVREPMLNTLPTDELERDRAAYALGLAYIRSEPFTFLSRMPAKFADFWGFERNLPDIAAATTRGTGWNSYSKIAADLFAMVVYVVIMLAGVAGLFLSPNDRWKGLLGGFVLYFLIVHLAIFGDGRFHLTLIPFFALYAGWMIIQSRRAAYTPARVGLTLVTALVLVSVWVREAWVAVQILARG